MLWITLGMMLFILLILGGKAYFRTVAERKEYGRCCRTLFHYPRHGDEE